MKDQNEIIQEVRDYEARRVAPHHSAAGEIQKLREALAMIEREAASETHNYSADWTYIRNVIASVKS